MATRTCEHCGEHTPAARFCTRCGEPLLDPFPPEDAYEGRVTRVASELAERAGHPSVTFDALRSAHDRYDRPLVGHLFEDETPEFLGEVSGQTVETYGGESLPVDRTEHLLVTDRRLLGLGTTDGGDTATVVPLSDVVDVEADTGWLSKRLVVTTADESTHTFDLRDVSEAEAEDVAAHLRSVAEGADSADADAYRLMEELDGAVAHGETAEATFTMLAEAFREADHPSAFDDVARDAESVEELLGGVAELAERRRSHAEEAPGSTAPGAGSANPLPADPAASPRQSPVEAVRSRLGRTARDADPRTVSEYAIGAGLGFGSYAVAASLSTPIGLGALLAGGAAAGAYASANPDSLLARIEPLELASSIRTRNRRLGSDPDAGEAGREAALGTIDHLRERELAHAEWLANADPDAVMRGARLAGEAAADADEDVDPGRASALGAGVGLLYDTLDEDQQGEVSSMVSDGVPGELTGGDADGTPDDTPDELLGDEVDELPDADPDPDPDPDTETGGEQKDS